jgi:hypothetical protein
LPFPRAFFLTFSRIDAVRQERIFVLIWYHQLKQFVFLSQVIDQTIEIAVTADNNGPVVGVELNHCVENQFGVDIPFYLSIRQTFKRLPSFGPRPLKLCPTKAIEVLMAFHKE